jgi:phospholipid/cholesterol/gamma-HCH transport system substrate-binding protein
MNNELKVGLTVLLAIVAAYIGFRYMSDMPIFRQTHAVVTEFDRVDGLGVGNIVYMNGVKIGSVRDIELTSDNRVRVVLSIELAVDIPVDSQARLTSIGLLDGKAIVIERGVSDQYVEYGGAIEGVYVDTMMETLAEKGQDLGDDISASFTELNQFLLQLNQTLNEENRTSIGKSIHNIESTTNAVSQVLTSRQKELEDAISSANRILAQLDTMVDKSRPQADTLMANLKESSEDLKKITRELDQSVDQLNQILVKINNGNGTIGQLLNDPSLYQNADSISVELHKLLKGINENPGRYLRHMKLIELF